MDGTTEGNGGEVVDAPAEIVPPDVARLVDEPVARTEGPGNEPPAPTPPAPPAVVVATDGDGVPWAWWVGLAVAVVGLGVMLYVIRKRGRADETHD